MVKLFLMFGVYAFFMGIATNVLMFYMDIDPKYFDLFAILNALVLYCEYFRPNFEKLIAAHNERVQREVEDFHKQKQAELDREDSTNGTQESRD